MINTHFVFITLYMLTSFSITNNEHQKQIPVIIDTDGEVPDFLAILYALKSKEFDVRGVTFNGDGWTHAASVQNVVDIADDIYPGKNLPVILGADYSLYDSDRDPDTLGSPGCTYQKAVPEGALGKRDQDLLYGINRQLRLSKRLWYDAIKGFNITKDLANLIDSTIEQTGKKPTIILTGPATNIATFLRAFPTYTTKIDKVFWMGGALNVPGNLFTVSNDSRAEYNVYLDCVAARELIASNLDITLVPLDFTDQIPFSPGVFNKLSKLKSFYGKFVYNLLSIIRKVDPGGDSTFFTTYHLWDPIAIAVAKNIGVAEIVSNRSLTVTCKGDRIYDGQFIRSKTLTNSNFKVAIDAIVSKPIESSPFYQDFLNVIDFD
ncbi:Inosine/uridine-preferring nucleoside hydrolase domain-containing protein [Gigaspora rosea]|uniref:Inosine/uridine-preferring nucleoside hydrolase domain-containing protein n=1 Tax=Gigaspora rosea TaxID=44941 RepID=A0A397WAG9_9GLOM|nr:Inosine/uridine-preferring nucleoside hydrolase domain-containing protein [Gigaspora rosea]